MDSYDARRIYPKPHPATYRSPFLSLMIGIGIAIAGIIALGLMLSDHPETLAYLPDPAQDRRVPTAVAAPPANPR